MVGKPADLDQNLQFMTRAKWIHSTWAGNDESVVLVLRLES